MVDVIDPRHYTDSSIAEYCLWTKPDLVITVLNPSSLAESRHFDFGTADPQAFREREILSEERITLEASDSDWHFYRLPFAPEPGKTYRFSFGSVSVTEGDTVGVSVLLFDFRSSGIIRHQIFDVGFSSQGGDWTFRVPVDGPEDADYGLLVYAGVHGSTGGNGLESGIPLGTPGAILSSGLILPLDICVGAIVSCTMYTFFALFRRGEV